jgi:Spy/CpxP family protein refolding chaperone
MQKLAIVALVALIPLTLFAQAPSSKPTEPFRDRQTALLKSFKLSDAQIAQVLDIEKAARSAAQGDFAHIRLLNAEIRVALLPSNANPDLQAIEKLIDQKAQFRADAEKAFTAAKVQLIQIMGNDNFNRLIRVHREHSPKRCFFMTKRQFGDPANRDPAGLGGMTLE